MEEWPDDHLDELFRKSAEEFDIHFNADDWTDMSRRLDEHDRHTMFDRISRWGGISALVLLLLGGLGWVMYDKKPTAARQQVRITVLTPARKATAQSTVASQSRQTEPSTDRHPRGTSQIDGRSENQAIGVANSLTKIPNSAGETNPAGQLTTKQTDNQPDESTNHSAVRPASESLANRFATQPASRRYVQTGRSRRAKPGVEQVVGGETTSAGDDAGTGRSVASDQVDRQLVTKSSRLRENQSAATERPVSLNTSARRGTDVLVRAAALHQNPDGNVPATMNDNQPDGHPAQTPVASQVAGADLVTSSQWLPALTPAASLSRVVEQAQETPAPPLPQVTVAAPASRAMPKLTGLSVFVFASPDLSGIGLTNFDRPGSNAGVSVQYQLTDRLSVNAGAMYSTKRYQTYANNYVWPSYMNMDVWPEEISGVCKMIDIPLNVRYDWLLRPRGDGRAPARWFASAGLTSYFIQHEVYRYEYANPADPKIKAWGWDNQKAGRAGGSFGFSNLNISVGYERPITNRLSWQVEPFLKVPLKQVGYFKIRLLSTGAFVGLRYRF
ncbi:hypothetical protein [Fibrella forsythiae]|uniref:Outer membrane protein beta-barrel domain-containing protein n=1 Tax=Fibrella forsythiae TaxID=2817061 RepID=A0ABS3JKL1_9BACT|nr:hypothetical protein [Fibrella forsythiae]MBO0950544.1 hypothetical protein [Fibrella forsythiae]